MQWNREIWPDTCLGEDQVASGLTTSQPTSLYKCLGGVFTRDIAELAHCFGLLQPILVICV
jgi:hypothetical protein